MTIRTSLLAAAIAAAVALTGCNRKTDDTVADTAPEPVATTPAPMPAEPAPMPATDPAATPGPNAPLSVQKVSLGTAADANNRIATSMTTFKRTDPIVVAVDTMGTAQNAQVTGKLVFQDGQTAGEETATLNTTGAQSTAMTFNNANGWPAGNYKAEIWVNGQLANTATFTVQ